MFKPANLTRLLPVGGILMLLAGLVAALYGPAEAYCFYLFSEGGRFHFEGFGFGSLVFASIAWQVIAYELIAVLLIPLGFGHLRRRRWARVGMIALLWCAWIAGAPLVVVFMFLLSFKDPAPAAALLAVLAAVLAYLALPGLLMRFYHSPAVRQVFESIEPEPSWVERLPMPVLVLALLFSGYVIALHFPLFFNGIFPLFGAWLSGLQGILALDLAILSLAGLTWGVSQRKPWAWWGSLAYFSLLTVSTLLTLLQSSFVEILAVMRLPPAEMEILKNVPLQGLHLAPFVGLPLTLTLLAILRARRCFGG